MNLQSPFENPALEALSRASQLAAPRLIPEPPRKPPCVLPSLQCRMLTSALHFTAIAWQLRCDDSSHSFSASSRALFSVPKFEENTRPFVDTAKPIQSLDAAVGAWSGLAALISAAKAVELESGVKRASPSTHACMSLQGRIDFSPRYWAEHTNSVRPNNTDTTDIRNGSLRIIKKTASSLDEAVELKNDLIFTA